MSNRVCVLPDACLFSAPCDCFGQSQMPSSFAMVLRAMLRAMLPFLLHTIALPRTASATGFVLSTSMPRISPHLPRKMEGVCWVDGVLPLLHPVPNFLQRSISSTAPAIMLAVQRGFGFARGLLSPVGSFAGFCTRSVHLGLSMVTGSGGARFGSQPSVVSWLQRPEFMQGRKKHLLLEADVPLGAGAGARPTVTSRAPRPPAPPRQR